MTADPWAEPPPDEEPKLRHVRLTPAAGIEVKPVRWLWADRLPTGSLSLLGGREGIGKSTLAYQLVGDITRGRLPGVHFGTPRPVVVAAAEDSWEHTIVPRLMAAGADLGLVFRIDVVTYSGHDTGLCLPRDLDDMEQAIRQVGAALVLLDPLLSRLDGTLDTHKDADVRRALEPLVRAAERSGATILGLIHLNKSLGGDPLTMLMGSRAFAAVARAVLFCMTDPDDDRVRVLGQPKNNLGRSDLPTLTFRVVEAKVADTDEGPVTTGRIEWQGETTRTLNDVLEAASDGPETRTVTQEAADWLSDWLTSQGGTDESANIKRAGHGAGHNSEALRRARRRLAIEVTSSGFPRRTFWTLPGTAPVASPPGESTPTDMTDTTDTTGRQSGQSRQSRQSRGTPRAQHDKEQP